MVEFLQNNGIWIVIGLFFSFMLWRSIRRQGMGCCGGGREHAPEKVMDKEPPGKGKPTAGCH
ncbi:MAG: hypothetical protein A2144_12540 [Chloroflexi bacterium RBG_16_50_9]|nr:MAG: hypothetical protein A2144_12540 [Chloroflexi bacterium RBG_16_50_9]